MLVLVLGEHTHTVLSLFPEAKSHHTTEKLTIPSAQRSVCPEV